MYDAVYCRVSQRPCFTPDVAGALKQVPQRASEPVGVHENLLEHGCLWVYTYCHGAVVNHALHVLPRFVWVGKVISFLRYLI